MDPKQEGGAKSGAKVSSHEKKADSGNALDTPWRHARSAASAKLPAKNGGKPVLYAIHGDLITTQVRGHWQQFLSAVFILFFRRTLLLCVRHPGFYSRLYSKRVVIQCELLTKLNRNKQQMIPLSSFRRMVVSHRKKSISYRSTIMPTRVYLRNHCKRSFHWPQEEQRLQVTEVSPFQRWGVVSMDVRQPMLPTSW